MKAAPETGPHRSGTRYSAADKLKAVKLYFEEGYQAKDIARELGIGKSSLGKWIREYREKGSGAFTSPPASCDMRSSIRYSRRQAAIICYGPRTIGHHGYPETDSIAVQHYETPISEALANTVSPGTVS